MSMQAALVMFRGEGERRTFPLSRNIVIVGRREDCDLRIPLGDVSRKHCRIVVEDGLRIQDLGSSNGTYVNNQRVQETDLNPGDVIRIGPVTFVVQINGEPPDDEIQLPEANPNTDTSVTSPSDSGINLEALDEAELNLGGEEEEVEPK
jgi:pSer/pThr/pTyr-binding forkhead associated (FHA) protein